MHNNIYFVHLEMLVEKDSYISGDYICMSLDKKHS
jgi:hypothetical protein